MIGLLDWVPAGCGWSWAGSGVALVGKAFSEMPHRVFRFEDRTPMSPLGELALDMVELMSKSGLVTVPGEPTDAMVDAAMEASGATEGQVRAVFKAMITAFDAGGVELEDFSN